MASKKRDGNEAAEIKNFEAAAEIVSEEPQPEPEPIPPTVPAEPEETAFTYGVLLSQCMKLFGVTRSTFVGAVKDNGGLYKISEVKRQIDEWLNKPTN